MVTDRGYAVSYVQSGKATPDEMHAFWHSLEGNRGLAAHHVFSPAPLTVIGQGTDRYSMHTLASDVTHRSTRTAQHISRHPAEEYLLLMPVSGGAWAAQGKDEFEAGPGTAILVPTWAPMEFATSALRGFVFKAPRLTIAERLRADPNAPIAFPLNRGLGTMTRDMFHSVYRTRDDFDTDEFNLAAERLAELLCMVAVGDRPPEHQLAGIAESLRRYVRAHAGDRSLSLENAALQLGWSPRQLQTAMQREGATYRGLVREERLEAARRRLGDPALSHRTITEIAMASGFASGQALSLPYRERYGETPREARARMQAARRPAV